MNVYESLNHPNWECKYHVIFIPKYRRKALYGSLRRHLGTVFRELARQKECEIEEGHLMVDHAYADRDSAEVFRVAGHGIHQGEKCDPHCADLCGEAQELCGAALLGSGLLGVHDRSE